MNTEEIIRNIEPRYTVVKNKDLGKDATVYYHEDDVKKAIAKALTLGNVSQQRELLKAYAELMQSSYTHHFFDDAVEESIDKFLSL